MSLSEVFFNELSSENVLRKSRLYRAGGYKEAVFLSRNLPDYSSHFFAFLIDLNICLLPVYLWVLEFLLILCGFIPPNFFDLLFYIMYALLFVISVLAVGIYTSRNHGQSLGYGAMGLKLVQQNKKEASALHLILRQALGLGIPIMVLGYFFQIIGMVVWMLVNALVVIITPNQQSIFDLVFKLKTVREPELPGEAVQPAARPVRPERPVSSVSPIDLHIRSNYSDDATCDVEELFKLAKKANLEVISITDHNCARANAAAVRFAGMYGIQYIPGVEIDAQYRGIRVRILGYYIDWTDEIFDWIERESLRREKEASMERVRKFEEFSGISIDVNSIINSSRFQTITARDITNMVFNNKVVRQMSFVKKYIDETENIRQAKRRFQKEIFGKNGPCYVTVKYPEAKEMIEAIHNAGGIAILASWHMDSVSKPVIEEMMSLGLDGIECFSPDLQDTTITLLLKIAQSRKAFVTAGSDFHGTTKPRKKLGVTNCPEKAIPLVRIIPKAAAS